MTGTITISESQNEEMESQINQMQVLMEPSDLSENQKIPPLSETIKNKIFVMK